MAPAGNWPSSADDLGMAAMADQEDMAARASMADRLAMHFGDQRTGGVQHIEPAARGLAPHRLGNAMGGENDNAVGRHLCQLLDEHRPLAASCSTTKRLWTISWRT